jgi:nucleoside-diphosphate-sugar epimerase
MKYLITGGAGFIGINLAKQLSKIKKNKIYLLDNFSKKIDKSALEALLLNKNVKIIKKDINNI